MLQRWFQTFYTVQNISSDFLYSTEYQLRLSIQYRISAQTFYTAQNISSDFLYSTEYQLIFY